MNASFLVVKMDFLASTCHFLYIFSRVRPVKVFFPPSGFFLLAETVTDMSGNQLLKSRIYSCWQKLIFWLAEIIFFLCLRYFSRSPSSRLVEIHFLVQKRKFCLLFRAFFHASGKHYLNYREVYLKLCHWQPFSLIFQTFLSMEAVFPLVKMSF